MLSHDCKVFSTFNTEELSQSECNCVNFFLFLLDHFGIFFIIDTRNKSNFLLTNCCLVVLSLSAKRSNLGANGMAQMVRTPDVKSSIDLSSIPRTKRWKKRTSSIKLPFDPNPQQINVISGQMIDGQVGMWVDGWMGRWLADWVDEWMGGF